MENSNNMSDIRIYIPIDKENTRIPKNTLIVPVQVGTALKNRRFPGMPHDDDGVNISDRNKSYCEMTAQYWAWKNINADYYGFFHYRRYLSFAEEKFSTVHEPFIFDEVVFPDNTDEYLKKICFDEKSMRKVIEEHDFVAPCASASLQGETVYEQYANSAGHHIEDLQCVMSIIRERYLELVPAMEEYLMGRKMYCCNMFIMKKELFMKYCGWLFDVLGEFEAHRDLSKYPPVDGRVTGYLAERLCGVYLTYLFMNGYNGIELQKVYFRETDPAAVTSDNSGINLKNITDKPVHLVKQAGRRGKAFAKKGAGKVYRELKDRVVGKPVYSRHKDDMPVLGTPEVGIIRVISDIDGRYILQFSVREMHETTGEKGQSYEICIHNEAGNEVLYSPVVELRDKVNHDKRFPEYDIRRTDYSCKLAGIPGKLVIELKKGDTSHEAIITDRQVLGAIKHWNNLSKSVSQYVDYNSWYLSEHRIKPNELSCQKHHEFVIQPLYSIIVPLYHTPISFFREMVDSVLAQTYGKFELILVNSTPEDGKLSLAIREYIKTDQRIRVTELEKNLGITENTNAGIYIARGDFLCFLDHDDLLEPDALYEYTQAINEKPETDLLYCDEDKKYGDVFTDPYFKPDYNPDLLMGINYICHFLTVRKSIVDTLSPATSRYDGAQDYHMTFRVSEKARYVNHIPRILYHWRIHDKSTASDPEQKSYTLEAARLCVEEHLMRTGIKGRAVNSLRVPRHYEVVYELPENRPLVSIIIPNKNNRKILERCIDSILVRTSYKNYEIVIVDNDSTDEDISLYYHELVKNDKIRIVPFNEEFNFAREINIGFLNCSGDYVVFLNNDTEVITNDWIEKMLGPLMRPEVGAVGAKLLFPDGTVQHAGIVMNDNGPMHLNQHLPRFAAGYYDTARLSMDVSAVTAACMMTKRTIFAAAGGMNEMLKVDYNDVDYCLKLRQAGYLVLFEAGVEIHHYESATRDEMDADAVRNSSYIKGQGYLMQKWSSYYMNGDPCYNKNFAKNSTYFCII